MGKDTAKREAKEREFILETGFLIFFLFCNYCELEDATKSLSIFLDYNIFFC
jgi:hypothetical protein